MYQKAEADLYQQKTKIQKSTLQQSQRQFFEIIKMKDINEQLDLLLLNLNNND